jgi:hypothetical protein
MIPFASVFIVQFALAAPPKQPAPPPAPPIPKGERIVVKAKGGGTPTAPVIDPKKGELFTEKDKTFFRLVPKGPGKLALQYHAKDAALELNLGTRMTIQLSVDEPLELDPGVITQAAWPKGAKEIPVSYTGGAAGETYHIVGAASYTACHNRTRDCKKKVSRFFLDLKL